MKCSVLSKNEHVLPRLSLMIPLNTLIQIRSLGGSSLPLLVVDSIKPQIRPIRHRRVLEVLLPGEGPGHHYISRPEDGPAQPGGVVRLARRLVYFEMVDVELVIFIVRQ